MAFPLAFWKVPYLPLGLGLIQVLLAFAIWFWSRDRNGRRWTLPIGVKDAPAWVKKAGLQWAHRLCQEPRRLWKRYLVNNSTFLVALGLQLTGLRPYPLPADHDGVPF